MNSKIKKEPRNFSGFRSFADSMLFFYAAGAAIDDTVTLPSATADTENIAGSIVVPDDAFTIIISPALANGAISLKYPDAFTVLIASGVE